MPKVACNFSQFSLELSGRLAGVGYSAVMIGVNLGSRVPRMREARSKMALAKPNQDVEPLSVMWYIPLLSSRHSPATYL